ncbi:GDSL-type esterase/lipase family protein [Actinoplanes sp. NPDC048796]|uniref:GDSL-type esterase/lipase family protein n=1 Tax=unclassified Actinoplanes TaxID=2626549 RepID=UPI0033D56D30
MRRLWILATAVLLAVTGWAVPARAAVDSNISFVGRWNRTNASAYVPYWAGAYLRVGFTGRTVKLKQRNTVDLWASIDGRPFTAVKGSGTINLTPTALAAGNHTLIVSYRQVAGSYTGDAVFQGLILDAGATTFKPPARSRMVEFIGDSITAGTTSSQLAVTGYGFKTGEKLGYDHSQIAIGGMCLSETADGCWAHETRYWMSSGGQAGTDAWDFSRYTPDTVVINLGTNDKSHGVSGADFQAKYTTFLSRLRARFPYAKLLALRTFIGRYAAETQAAVRARTAAGDANVAYVDTTGWLPADGLSDSVHPNDKGHQAITDRLAPIIGASSSLCATATPAVATAPAAAATTVWMAGDSTMMNASACPIGWGSQLASYLTSEATVRNSAVGGRSIQTWLYEGNVTGTKNAAGECVLSSTSYSSRWTAMLAGFQPGDHLIVQFGINDGTSACPRHVGSARFKELLGVMASAAKARGVKPIFVTPVAAITCSGGTAVGNRGFVTETKDAAAANGVPVIDLHARSVALYNTLKLCPNNGDYTTGAVGAFFCNDHTHFEAAGARQIAGVIATALREQNLPLAAYLR